ncbi:MAG TPA: SRPBCC domain-containing protein, partial [Gemmatimonadaceae bacterium]|nr:SRPBCC domain-containing protein [Gemmatimonadaceae bacterium]
SDAHGNIVDSPPGLAGYSLITATFAEHDGRTTVTIVHAGVEQASTANQTNYQLGWGESLDRLAERLAAI